MQKILTCTAEHPLPDGEIRLLGTVDNVTPTMNLITMAGETFLVDAGVPRSKNVVPSESLNVDTLFLTHAHNDHLSGLAQLVLNGKLKRVVATAPTIEIARIQVRDGIRLNGGSSGDFEKFERVFNKIAVPVTYGVKIASPLDAVDCIFHQAGHILGSASIEFRSPLSRVIISGDLGRPHSPILRDYNTTWSDDRPVDLVLMETTYGDREQEAAPPDLEEALERAVNHALKDGGHILVPAFAIGRTQVLLYLLNNLVEAGRIPEIPVAVDTPMGLSVTQTYKRFVKLYDRDYLRKLDQGDDPIDFDNLFAIHRSGDSRRIDNLTESMLILSASGMCTGGRIVHHLKALLPRPETDVIFVGYQAPNTPGHEIQRIGKEPTKGHNVPTVVLDGKKIPVHAQITTLKGISAHADRKELAHWLSSIPNVKTVALHHGTRKAQEAFRSYVST